MIFALDTTVVSALMRSEPGPSARLLAAAPGDVGVPQPVIAEIRYGLARLPTSRRRRALESRLDLLLESLERIPWDDDVSAIFGAVKATLEAAGTRADDFDVAIAAHALARDAAIVTANVRHFARIPDLRVESWR